MTKARSVPLALFSLMLAVFSVGTAEYVIAGIMPEIAADLGVTIPQAGSLITAYALSVVFGGPLLTALTARYSRLPLMLWLLVLFLAGNLLAALSPNFEVLMAARILSALTHSTFFAVSLVTASSLAAKDQQGRAIARVALGLNLATVLGVPIGTWIGQHYGWRATFFTVAAITLLSVLFVLFFVPSARSTIEARPSGVLHEFSVLRNRNVLLAMAMTVLGQTGLFTLFTYISPFLKEVSGFNGNEIVVVLLLFGVGSAVGNIIGGHLADRALLPSLVLLQSGTCLSLTAIWALADSKLAMYVLIFVLGAFGFSVIPGLQSRIIQFAANAPTLALALNISAFQVANAAGSFIGGRVIDDGLGVRTTTVVGAGVSVLAVLVATLVMVSERHVVNKKLTSEIETDSEVLS